ncbi:hypothetical protein PFICI_04398 [Pestalotiopsis fici W106-1]|uniref:Heterokaryon incompatibility domain-containing protein n=1 Tax=Pestalotiopsis fici (strain W106-1 / CGMCC3.15140) TaxID=1229662 RepID=W3XAR0_PESFW|nr:uncharacterized protein PFICI_04398 [Pestalotiopsis fici W106-1]ETS82522.1 hypothetical protein PFICI_04398 [Pestalotiopsis fici W106-1]
MTLCTPCATIDLDAIRRGDYWELKNSKDMRESASNGCDGCSFFLDSIKNFSKRLSENFEDFVEQARPMRIGKFYDGNDYYLEVGSDDVKDYVNFDLCAAETGFNPPNDEGPKRPISQDLNGDEFELARIWLDRCSQHEHCDAQEDTQLPTRLIQVHDKSTLHICPTQKDWRGKYVALSHCWGKKPFLKTEHSNFQRLVTGFDYEELPRSFQDAVTLTRKLGFRYLWIDALCIIQDDEEDWARESVAMTQVYQNASLVISANAAPDSSSGFLARKVFRSHRFGTGAGLLLWQSPAITGFKSFAEIRGEPLDRRAWTYQEKIMAKRILYFLKSQMAWGCSTCIYTESMGTTPTRHASTHGPSIKLEIHRFMRAESTELEISSSKWESLRSRLDCWYYCIQEYTHRDLTKAGDKLPAFSGLSSGLCIPELGNYLAGLWEVDLFRGLGWRYVDRGAYPVRDYNCYVAPSWSYMCAQGRIKLIGLDFERQREASDSELLSERRWKEVYRPQLIDHDIKPVLEENKYGAIKPGWILIRACCRRILVQRSPMREAWHDEMNDDHDRLCFDTLDGRFVWRFDATDGYHCPKKSRGEFESGWGEPWADDGEVDEYTAVQIYRYRREQAYFSDQPPQLFMLILSSTFHNREEAYERVGIVSVPLSDEQLYHEKWQSLELKLF